MLRLQARLLRLYSRSGSWLARRLHRNFYLYLALLLGVAAIIDATRLHWIFDLRQTSFDQMVKHRVRVTPPDPEIVIVDIDENSLAQLGGELGRWPWPRQVLADVLTPVVAQQPRAIVFDILFSEADLYNPDSDAGFDAFLQQCDRCYLPWVRLDPAQDRLSELKASQVPGALPLKGGTPGPSEGGQTIAGILPLFPGALASGRLGYNTAMPDRDGIIRQYAVYEDRGGVRLPSLPTRVLQGRELSAGLQGLPPAMLINWRGKPFSYRYISFADLYRAALSEKSPRPPAEFRNKIVIIGSTAASLFDVKATPVADQFPGVEIVATAIDNLKHDDYLRVPPLRSLYLLLALLLIGATAWSFYRHADPEKLARWFGLSQVALLAISWASINFSVYYINLLGPVSFAIAYFSLAKLYAYATQQALERAEEEKRLAAGRHGYASVAWLRLADSDGEPMPSALLLRLQQDLPQTLGTQGHALSGSQHGLWRLLEGSLLLGLLTAQTAEALQPQLQDAVQQWLQRHQLTDYRLLQCRVHSAAINGSPARELWLTLMAAAIAPQDSLQVQETR